MNLGTHDDHFTFPISTSQANFTETTLLFDKNDGDTGMAVKMRAHTFSESKDPQTPINTLYKRT